MKKLLLLAALAASFTPSFAEDFSDSFTLTFEGETITDGQTVDVKYYWDPILKEYPELIGTMEPGDFYTEADIRATNISEEPKVLQFSLKLLNPAAEDFKNPDSKLGNVQLCYDFETAAGNCLEVRDGFLDYYTDIDPVSAEEYIKILVEQRGFNEFTPVSLQLDLRVMDDEEVAATSTIYVNFTHQADITTGVSTVVSDANAEYFTIQGVRVAEPQKGQIYIERKGSTVTKRVF